MDAHHSVGPLVHFHFCQWCSLLTGKGTEIRMINTGGSGGLKCSRVERRPCSASPIVTAAVSGVRGPSVSSSRSLGTIRKDLRFFSSGAKSLSSVIVIPGMALLTFGVNVQLRSEAEGTGGDVSSDS